MTAAFAYCASRGSRWRSSRTRPNQRPLDTGLSARTLVDTTVPPGGAVVVCSGTSIASNVDSTWGSPSSVRAKSPRLRPPTGRPFESVTTTSTVTISTRAGNSGTSAPCWGWAPSEAKASPGDETSATARPVRPSGAGISISRGRLESIPGLPAGMMSG